MTENTTLSNDPILGWCNGLNAISRKDLGVDLAGLIQRTSREVLKNAVCRMQECLIDSLSLARLPQFCDENDGLSSTLFDLKVWASYPGLRREVEINRILDVLQKARMNWACSSGVGVDGSAELGEYTWRCVAFDFARHLLPTDTFREKVGLSIHNIVTDFIDYCEADAQTVQAVTRD